MHGLNCHRNSDGSIQHGRDCMQGLLGRLETSHEDTVDEVIDAYQNARREP
ncbi:hypothetical protein [Streptomyces carpaticus]|uniref:Uncharacterized protein n=1 Tax=Streptomyces carpaticus TaxID=285558 RepID=A0ABV4ZRI9_9ACTN